MKKFLVDHGIAADRVIASSDGKTGAAPQPSRWRKDRPVDIDPLE
jgi:hypothetical protein